MKNCIRVKGFLRLQVVDKAGKITGDSGLVRNTVTNYGLNNACAGAAIGATNSVQVVKAVLGTQTVSVNVTAVSLAGTTNAVASIVAASSATGRTR